MTPEAQQDADERQSRTRTFVSQYASQETQSKADICAFKFGGSSLLGADRMLHAAALVRDAALHSNVVVVVSAMKGITDRLLAVARLLAAGCRTDARRDAEHIVRVHEEVLRDLQLEPQENNRAGGELHLLANDLLHDASPEKQPSSALWAALQDRLASYGERFSARLFAAALEKSGVPAVPVSSSEFVLTCDTFRDARPQMEETRRRGREILLPLFADGIVPVVTGFIGSTRDGRVTTLGRNSSDFSGALIAHVVDADELVIWTDVDGVYTANPHESAEAKLLHELSYDEAHALAAAGAKVLHAKVLPLAAETEMVVWVRNTFNPRVRGTRIGPNVSQDVPQDAAASASVMPHAHARPSERSESAPAYEQGRGIFCEFNVSHRTVPSTPNRHDSNSRGAA
jgi:bifunctional aspartokinase / homoserine dehydrogenase 1